MADAEYQSRGLSYMGLCGPGGKLASDAENDSFCHFANEVTYARAASLATGLTGVLLLALILGARGSAGHNRKRLVRIFNPIVRIVIVVLGLSMVAQAALFIYCAYTIETTAIHRVHAVLLLSIGLAAIIGCFELLKTGIRLFQVKPTSVRGRSLSREEAPELFALVETLASKLAAEKPNHIVAGLEPNFFVTVNDVVLIREKPEYLQGRTLFVSLSLMRVFTTDELASVIGHELGHFRGEDTEYSLRFAPIYSRLSMALVQISSSTSGAAQLAMLPAVATLRFVLETFAGLERTVGRERELLADKAGAEAASATALAHALVKLALYSDSWNALTRKHIEMLSEGRQFTDLAQVFRSVCDSNYGELDWGSRQESLSKYIQPHPIDTHPPLSQRLESLGVPASSIAAYASQPAETPAISLIPAAEQIEQAMTSLEVQYLAAIGAVSIPKAGTPPEAVPA
jgi:Zn-dependent protease with chaperone function